MDINNKLINVAAAFIINDGKVLVAKRKVDGKWEFPGGKFEDGEIADGAIVREIKEELNIDVKPIDEVGSVEIITSNEVTIIVFIRCEASTFDITLKDHDEYEYVSFEDLSKIDFIEADKKFIIDFNDNIKICMK